jgi:hypothetical protein
VFVLAGLLWAVVRPLRPERWSFGNVLLFTTLTAPPALLYAIPVERFLSPFQAREANLWFLGIVAAWRVALFGTFLRRVGRLDFPSVFVGTLTPICLVIVALAFLNLEHVIFNLMGGLRPEERSPNDRAYEAVVVMAVLSTLLFPVLLVMYGILVRGKAGWPGDGGGGAVSGGVEEPGGRP